MKKRNDMRDAYLYNVELLTTGRLEEVFQQMTPGTEYYQKLLALKHLHDGDAVTALQLFTQLLKDKGGEVSKSRSPTLPTPWQ